MAAHDADLHGVVSVVSTGCGRCLHTMLTCVSLLLSCQQGAGGGCTQCVTNDGASHTPESNFVLREGCIHYQCRCNCDGSWNCPGEAARNVCRGEVRSGTMKEGGGGVVSGVLVVYWG